MPSASRSTWPVITVISSNSARGSFLSAFDIAREESRASASTAAPSPRARAALARCVVVPSGRDSSLEPASR